MHAMELLSFLLEATHIQQWLQVKDFELDMLTSHGAGNFMYNMPCVYTHTHTL